MRHNNTLKSATTSIRKATILSLAGAIIQGCSLLGDKMDGPPDKEVNWQNIPNPAPRDEPRSKRGNPESYVVMGKRYFVSQKPKGYTQQGIASWYGTKFHGRLTSSGEVYDMHKMTAAHKTLPIPVYVKVSNVDNGKHIIVRVNDRGPFVSGRIIDLSYTAAKKLGITQRGTANVKIETISNTVAPAAPPSDTASSDLGGNQTLYFLQLGAFSQRVLAEQFAAKLIALPIEPVVITNSTRNQNPLYLVRVGPFQTTDQLEPVESQLIEQGFTDTYTVSEPAPGYP